MKLYTLSIRQPWAWAILHAGKDVENRSWALPKYIVGLPVLLHAGLRQDRPARQGIEFEAGVDIPATLPFGGVVGLIKFGAMAGQSLSPWADPRLNHWPIIKATALPFFPCKGRLGFFEVDYPHTLPNLANW